MEHNIVMNINTYGVFTTNNQQAIDRYLDNLKLDIERSIDYGDFRTARWVQRAHAMLSEKDFLTFMALWANYDYYPIVSAIHSMGSLFNQDQLFVTFKTYNDKYIVINFNAERNEK